MSGDTNDGSGGMRTDGDDEFCNDYAILAYRNIPQSRKQYSNVGNVTVSSNHAIGTSRNQTSVNAIINEAFIKFAGSKIR